MEKKMHGDDVEKKQQYILNVEMARALIRNQFDNKMITKAQMKKADEIADKMIAEYVDK